MNDELMNHKLDLLEPLKDSNTETSIEIVQTVGGLLKSGRENKNLSIQQVSDQLKLSSKQIIALESNQFHLLPAMVIVRGFVRAYAKMLKIDANPILDLLPQEQKDFKLEESLKPALSTPFVESKMSLLGSSDTNKKYIIGAATLVVLVGLFYIVQNSNVSQFFNSISHSPNKVVIVEPVNQSVNNTVKALPPTLPQKVMEAPVQSSTQESHLTIEAASVKLPTSDLTPEKKEQVNAGGDNLLVLKFRENSWVQIKAENGSILAERLVLAGAEEKYLVNQVLKLKIGNAAGVDGYLRGESLKIGPVNGSNVINLSIK